MEERIVALSSLGFTQDEIIIILQLKPADLLSFTKSYEQGRLESKYRLHSQTKELAESHSQPAIDTMLSIQKSQEISGELYRKGHRIDGHTDYYAHLKKEIALKRQTQSNGNQEESASTDT